MKRLNSNVKWGFNSTVKTFDSSCSLYLFTYPPRDPCYGFNSNKSSHELHSHLNTVHGGWLALTLTRLKVCPYVSILTSSKGWDSSLRRSFWLSVWRMGLGCSNFQLNIRHNDNDSRLECLVWVWWNSCEIIITKYFYHTGRSTCERIPWWWVSTDERGGRL